MLLARAKIGESIMSRYSITTELNAATAETELNAATAEEAVSLVAVGDIVELLNLDMLMQPHGGDRSAGDVEEELDDESD